MFHYRHRLEHSKCVSARLPTTLCAMGTSDGRPVFGNGPAYPIQHALTYCAKNTPMV